MDNITPKWISNAHKALKVLGRILGNERGEVAIPFIDSVAEESRPAVTDFITNSGATTEDLAGYKTFDEFLTGYKPKPVSSPEWLTELPEEHKSLLGIKGWKKPGDIIKSYTEIEKLVGLDKIPLPKKDGKGQYEKGELQRYLSAIGLPKDVSGYKVSENFKLPEGVNIDPTLMESFKAESYEQGLLPHQFAFVMDKLSGILTKGQELEKANNEKSFNATALALRTKWGVAYEQKTALANKVLQGFIDDKGKGQEIIKKYGNDPILIEVLANIGENLSEDALTRVSMSGQLLDPAAAKSEIEKIRAEHLKELSDVNDPQHKYWVDKLNEFYKMAG